MTDIAAEPANLPDASPFHMRGNYAPVADELTEYDLPVQGEEMAHGDFHGTGAGGIASPQDISKSERCRSAPTVLCRLGNWRRSPPG